MCRERCRSKVLIPLNVLTAIRSADQEQATTRFARSRWTWALSIGLAAVLLYFSLRGVEWQRVGKIIANCSFRYLALAICCGTLAYIVRGLRWRVLLTAHENLSFTTVLWASSVGYLGNNFLPARAGELVRTAMISSRSQLSRTYVLTTAIAERVVDLVILVLIGSSVALALGQTPAWLNGISIVAAGAGILGIVLLALLPRVDAAGAAVIERLWLKPAWKNRVARMLESATLAMKGFRNASRVVQFAVLTVAIWLLDATGAVLLAHALGMHLSIAVALLLLTGLGVGSALPSTPGAVGIFQFVAVTVLVPFHFTRTDAIAFILVAQATGCMVITALGLIGLWRYSTSADTVRSQELHVEDQFG